MDAVMHPTSPRFWNRFARRYARQPIGDMAAYRHKLGITQRYLRPNMRVMEFGCGTGGTARHHAPHVADYLAVDYAPAMIEIARARTDVAQYPNLRYAVTSIEELAHTRWDMILGLSILHLVPDRRGVIAKVHDMLEPGGLFVSSTVCIGDMPWYVRAFVAAGGALRVLPKVARLTPAALLSELRQAGFGIEQDWQADSDKALFVVARKPT